MLVAADAQIPYRPFLEVLFTLASSGAPSVRLLVESGPHQAVIDVGPSFSVGSQECKRLKDKRLKEEMQRIAARLVSPAERAAQVAAARRAILQALSGDGATPFVQLPQADASTATYPAVEAWDAGPPKGRPLCLQVIVIADGFFVEAAGQQIDRGCSGPGGGAAVPNRAGAYDFTALAACAARLRGLLPEYGRRDRHDLVAPAAAETEATVAANSDVELQTVVAAMDSLRSSSTGGPGFQRVLLDFPRSTDWQEARS